MMLQYVSACDYIQGTMKEQLLPAARWNTTSGEGNKRDSLRAFTAASPQQPYVTHAHSGYIRADLKSCQLMSNKTAFQQLADNCTMFQNISLLP